MALLQLRRPNRFDEIARAGCGASTRHEEEVVGEPGRDEDDQ
jgi:hypothetical protein